MESIISISLFLSGILFIILAILSFRKDWKSTTTALCIISFLSIFSSQGWVRGFLKTTVVDIITTYGTKIDDFQLIIEKQSRQITQQQKKLESAQRDISEAQKQISSQQEKLSDTDRILKEITSATITEQFSPNQDPIRMIVLDHGDRKVSVYLLLSYVPIRQSLELQYHIYRQPRFSYWNIENLVILRWGDNPSRLYDKPLQVTYAKDKTIEATIKNISLRNGRAFADDRLIMFAYPEFEPDTKKDVE